MHIENDVDWVQSVPAPGISLGWLVEVLLLLASLLEMDTETVVQTEVHRRYGR